MRVRHLVEATSDLDGVLQYYAAINAELANALLVEVERAVQRIVELPEAWRPLGDGFRRHSIRGFPYTIIYRHGKDEIVIVAYAHHRRRPRFWRGRLQDSA